MRVTQEPPSADNLNVSTILKTVRVCILFVNYKIVERHRFNRRWCRTKKKKKILEDLICKFFGIESPAYTNIAKVCPGSYLLIQITQVSILELIVARKPSWVCIIFPPLEAGRCTVVPVVMDCSGHSQLIHTYNQTLRFINKYVDRCKGINAILCMKQKRYLSKISLNTLPDKI